MATFAINVGGCGLRRFSGEPVFGGSLGLFVIAPNSQKVVFDGYLETEGRVELFVSCGQHRNK